MGVGASQGLKKGASPENKATALLLNPKAHGYNKIIGDPNSPTLWNPKDPREWVLLTLVFSIGPLFFFFFRKKEPHDPIWLTIVKSATVWIVLSLPVILIPINPFHRRMLYNFKVFLARIVEQPAKELFMAFLFIVLFPLPGGEKSTASIRLVWLAMKLGIFYILQNLLLGAPKYIIDPPEKEKILYVSKSGVVYYSLIIIGIILIIVGEKYISKKSLKKIV
jgi:hypothetical protein